MTPQQLKEEAEKEFDWSFVDEDDNIREGIFPSEIKDFIDSLITKAYEEGKKQKN